MDGEFPLVVGASLTGDDGPILVSLSRNFVPQSVQRANTGHLYTMDADDAEAQTFYLLPHLPAGENDPVYFQGQLEEANPTGATGNGATGNADVECVAIFDQASGQWTLETVTYKIATRLQRGVAPGASLLTDIGAQPQTHDAAASAAVAEAAAAAGLAGQQPTQPLPSCAFGDELNAALFGDEEEQEEGPGQEEEEQPPAQQQGQPQQQQQQQQQQEEEDDQQQQEQQQEQQLPRTSQPPPQQQPQQPAPQPQQHHYHGSSTYQQPALELPEEDHVDDAVWDDVLPPLPAAAAASVPAPAPVAAAASVARQRGMVVVEDDGDGDMHHCSDDDSDGVGMEVV